MNTQLETRLQNRIERRAMVQGQHEELLRERGENDLSDGDKQQIGVWRGIITELDTEIEQLTEDVDAHNRAIERSKALQKARLAATPGVDEDGDGVVYRDMATYARDVILTHDDRYARAAIASAVNREDIDRAAARLELLQRTPATTLTSDLAGLNPPQHIAQIFQVINTQRDLVNAAGIKADLDKGTVTYPQVDGTPVVAVQGTQKTEAGNTGMDISMVTKTASTYLGGGNLSWQAIQWSTPNALELWFREAAAHYALMTETDAATVVSANAFLNNIASTITGTPTFAQLMTAIGAGGAEVYANSGRIANAVIMAPDRYWYALGLTSDSNLNFGQSGALQLRTEERSLRVVVSRGLNAGEIIVGDLGGLLVAETRNAPVQLMVSEPAIAGVEVGIVGSFEAAVVDDGAFALITTAS